MITRAISSHAAAPLPHSAVIRLAAAAGKSTSHSGGRKGVDPGPRDGTKDCPDACGRVRKLRFIYAQRKRKAAPVRTFGGLENRLHQLPPAPQHRSQPPHPLPWTPSHQKTAAGSRACRWRSAAALKIVRAREQVPPLQHERASNTGLVAGSALLFQPGSKVSPPAPPPPRCSGPVPMLCLQDIPGMFRRSNA